MALERFQAEDSRKPTARQRRFVSHGEGPPKRLDQVRAIELATGSRRFRRGMAVVGRSGSRPVRARLKAGGLHA